MEVTDAMNIGLFPLSGIRVCDTELLELGLTLPGFVERSKTIASLPSLGLLTLAGMTPGTHDLHYVEVPDARDVDPLPEGLDLAAISTYSAQIDEAYELADRFRSAGVPVVIGGPHVSALPDEAAAHCDAVAVGEGEPVWARILQDAEAGKLAPCYRSDPDDYDMADAPAPAFDLLDISKYNRLTVQTSRGCPHHCEFCASSVVLTEKYKQKPVAKVLDEIEAILRIWPKPFIEFADDNSFVNHSYWKELLANFKDKHLKWFAETDIFDEVFAFVRDCELYEVQITVMTPFPGTPLYQRLEREDRLLEPVNWKKCTLFDINFRPASMSVEELHDRFRKLAVELYSDEFTKWRRSRFKETMRSQRRTKE